ncbi:EpsG family protein [Vibrio metschnikovii]|nr:EpsG family protein [Vibrio metschnikovii]EKO3711586.1 EpsG family protein [Vibrio metschnikovii]
MNKNMFFNGYENASYFAYLTFVFLLLLSLSYSPIFSVFLCVLAPLIFSDKHRVLIAVVGFTLSASLAIIYSGKLLVGANSTDFLIYYQYYGEVSRGIVENDRFGFAYYTLNYFLSFLDLSEIQFSIVLNFLCIYLNYIAVCFFLKKKHPECSFFIIVVISCFIFKVGSLTLFYRQGLASAFIIFALSETSKLKTLFFYVIAISFHKTSFFIFPFCYLILRNNYDYRYLLLPFIFALSWLFFITKFIHYLPDKIYSLMRFSLNTQLQLMHLIDPIKTVIYFIPILFVWLFFFRRSKINSVRPLLFIVLFVLILAPIPHSFRIIFPFSVVLISLYGAILMTKIKSYFPLIYILLLFFGMYRFISDDLSVQYELVGNSPFYYMFVEAR